MELFAPLLLALLFVVFGLLQRGRSHGCGACGTDPARTCGAACPRAASPDAEPGRDEDAR